MVASTKRPGLSMMSTVGARVEMGADERRRRPNRRQLRVRCLAGQHQIIGGQSPQNPNDDIVCCTCSQPLLARLGP